MSWRPKNWKNPMPREWTREPFQCYEAGADAMLKAIQDAMPEESRRVALEIFALCSKEIKKELLTKDEIVASYAHLSQPREHWRVHREIAKAQLKKIINLFKIGGVK